ncbi:hypothetical protein OZX67_01565 [Bifidobacterium sp. ESL0728]|uniref:hypothetical protein n=1 Tax=Bifidobacterium sp. ESL0728 TaxID=2983220 RepID=UPI0023F7F69D|nr:hypothetical protein [Bifidobacterium sp. ESL0728]WEV59287.1 hypothetical protein OZX67_01565 [Bifidobacterium sp. ESL0728]
MAAGMGMVLGQPVGLPGDNLIFGGFKEHIKSVRRKLHDGICLWGPDRETHTMANPARSITFDTITDDPQFGDERAFVVIRDATGLPNSGPTATGRPMSGEPANGSPADGASRFSNSVEAIDDHVYMVRALIHNTAAESLQLVARNVRFYAAIPTGVNTDAMVQGTISADNCGEDASGAVGKPMSFWDEAHLHSDSPFIVGLIPGTGRYYNNVRDFTTDGFPLSDSMCTNEGALLGYEQMDGRIQSCFQYSGYATFLVRVRMVNPSDPNYNMPPKPVSINPYDIDA